MPYLIDTHAHISHFPAEEQKAILDRAREAGVKKLINVACDLDQIAPHLAFAKTDDHIWSSAGVHPTSLNEDLEGSMKMVRDAAKNEEKIVAIGEIGLDYYHDKFPHEMQDAWLTKQLEIASELNLPAIIHCRAGKNPGENESAFIDLIHILEREVFSNAVIHCFSGNQVEAQKLLDLGLMLSFTGITTYESNENLREVVGMVPLDRIMLETDCPYLTIEGKRGQAGEPAFMPEIAKCIASVKGLAETEVIEQIQRNTESFFNI